MSDEEPIIAGIVRRVAEAHARRGCTCHPSERPEPCQRKFAARECWQAAVLADTQDLIVRLKNRDRSPADQVVLNYLMRVRTALEI